MPGRRAARVLLGCCLSGSSRPLTGQGSGRHPASCTVLWSGNTGSLLLAQCDHRQETIAGTAVTRVRLAVAIAVSTYIQSRWFAW